MIRSIISIYIYISLYIPVYIPVLVVFPFHFFLREGFVLCPRKTPHISHDLYISIHRNNEHSEDYGKAKLKKRPSI